ncbi:MAG: phosphoribosylaminoimidazolesuccinocarboxamide synthase [Planctomycetota bacterium]
MTDVYLGRDDAPPGLRQIASGKVRDIYELGSERLLFVTTDRVSAFDVVMNEGMPHKGRVLTRIAAHWFGRTEDIVSNHLISTDIDSVDAPLTDAWRDRLRGRIMVVEKAEPDPIEWVVREYLDGSGWREYVKQGTVCSIPVPPGLERAARLPERLVTPTTKHEDHDRPLSPEEAEAMVGPERWEEGKRICLALFERGSEELRGHDLILADTKFELGRRNGRTILIDEALTPDSSRMWAKADYSVGASPPSYDKQILRNWLETLDWNMEYPPPTLDGEVLERVAQRYLEVCEMLTGGVPEGAA